MWLYSCVVCLCLLCGCVSGCSQVLPVSARVLHRSQLNSPTAQDSDYVMLSSTVYNFKLSLNQTVCLQIALELPGFGTEASEEGNGSQIESSATLMLRMGYQQLWHVYTVLDSYEFAVPLIDSHCICDCVKQSCLLFQYCTVNIITSHNKPIIFSISGKKHVVL